MTNLLGLSTGLSEEQLQVLFSASSEGLLTFDFGTNVRFANAAAQRILDLGDENLREHLSNRQLSGRDGSALTSAQEPLTRILRGDMLTDERLCLTLESGADIYISLSGMLLNNFLGLAIVRDLTPQRSAEALFFRNFNKSPAASLVVSAETLEVLHANTSLLQFLDCARYELLGRSLSEVRLLSEAHVLDLVEESVRHCSSLSSASVKVNQRGGFVRLVTFSAEPLKLEQGPCALLSFVAQAEPRYTEEQLVQAIQAVLEDGLQFGHLVMDKLTQLSGDEAQQSLADLTEREVQVVALIAQGYHNKKIASDLQIAEQTVRNYVTKIYDKLQVHTRAEAAVWARRRGLGA